MCILAKFNKFSRSWKLILKFNTFSIPRGNPERLKRAYCTIQDTENMLSTVSARKD